MNDPEHHLAANLPGQRAGNRWRRHLRRPRHRPRAADQLPHDPKWAWSVTDPELAGRPGWANTSGEMPSRRQAMDRLIERWHELRAFSRA